MTDITHPSPEAGSGRAGHFKPSWKRLLLGAAAFIALAVVVDQAVDRVLVMGEPKDFRVFFESRRAFDADPSRYDGLIIGDSFTADALDPAVIARYAKISLFNHAIYNSSMGDQYFILQDKLTGGWTPDLVVIGLTPLLFIRDDEPTRFGLDFVSAPLLRAEAMWRGLVAGDLSIPFATGRHRYLLPGVARVLAGGQSAAGRGLDIGRVEAGYIENLRRFKGDREAVVADGAEMRAQIATFDGPRPEQVAYLHRTIAAATGAGARVVLVMPPVSLPQAQALDGSRYMAAFRSMARDVARQYDLPLVEGMAQDIQSRFPADLFFDAEHMCADGSRLFSAIVGEQLVRDDVVAPAAASGGDEADLHQARCRPAP